MQELWRTYEDLLRGGRPGPVLVQDRVAHHPVPAEDVEAAAFHEAVPGHHLRLSRLQLFIGIPAATDG